MKGTTKMNFKISILMEGTRSDRITSDKAEVELRLCHIGFRVRIAYTVIIYVSVALPALFTMGLLLSTVIPEYSYHLCQPISLHVPGTAASTKPIRQTRLS